MIKDIYLVKKKMCAHTHTHTHTLTCMYLDIYSVKKKKDIPARKGRLWSKEPKTSQLHADILSGHSYPAPSPTPVRLPSPRLQQAGSSLQAFAAAVSPPGVSSLPPQSSCAPGKQDRCWIWARGSERCGCQRLLCLLPVSYFTSLSLCVLFENRDGGNIIHWL